MSSNKSVRDMHSSWQKAPRSSQLKLANNTIFKWWELLLKSSCVSLQSWDSLLSTSTGSHNLPHKHVMLSLLHFWCLFCSFCGVPAEEGMHSAFCTHPATVTLLTGPLTHFSDEHNRYTLKMSMLIQDRELILTLLQVTSHQMEVEGAKISHTKK